MGIGFARRSTWKKTKYLLEIIGNVLLAFLLKENVPVEDAENLAGKVREKKMGMLFENMQKMDIQEAWRKTAEQRMRAEEAEQKAEELTKKLEAGIRFLVESCRNDGIGQEATRNKLVEIYQVDNAVAEKKMMQYWR